MGELWGGDEGDIGVKPAGDDENEEEVKVKMTNWSYKIEQNIRKIECKKSLKNRDSNLSGGLI